MSYELVNVLPFNFSCSSILTDESFAIGMVCADCVNTLELRNDITDVKASIQVLIELVTSLLSRNVSCHALAPTALSPVHQTEIFSSQQLQECSSEDCVQAGGYDAVVCEPHGNVAPADLESESTSGCDTKVSVEYLSSAVDSFLNVYDPVGTAQCLDGFGLAEPSVKAELATEDWHDEINASNCIVEYEDSQKGVAPLTMTCKENLRHGSIKLRLTSLSRSLKCTGEDAWTGEHHSLSGSDADNNFTLSVTKKARLTSSSNKRRTIANGLVTRAVCTVCGAEFTRDDSLRRHMTMHTGQKPFTCELCGRDMSRKDTLIAHMRKCRVKMDG